MYAGDGKGFPHHNTYSVGSTDLGAYRMCLNLECVYMYSSASGKSAIFSS